MRRGDFQGMDWRAGIFCLCGLCGLLGCGGPFSPNGYNRGPGYYNTAPGFAPNQAQPLIGNLPGTVPVSSPTGSPPIVSPSAPNGPGSNPPTSSPSGLQLTPTAQWNPQWNTSNPSIIQMRGQSTDPRFFQNQTPLAMVAGSGQLVDGRPLPFGGTPQPKTAVLRTFLHPKSRAEQVHRTRVSSAIAKNQALSGGVAPTPEQDLKFRGGRTLQDLKYVNLFVGGKELWPASDRANIDWALEAALQDPNLNHVMMQYFNGQPITAQMLGSFYLTGYKPTNVTQADVRQVVTALYQAGNLKNYPLPQTVFNMILPRGVILEDPDGAQAKYTHAQNPAIPVEDQANSKEGLGGYHGSVHVGADTLYYAVCVSSERRADGYTNGIPAFPESWKNVVATFYHELQEARTDLDVDDAMTGNANALGWTSDKGEECGDYPLEETPELRNMFVEVPLSDGRGVVPIQYQYSNAVHGPEGPIPVPHSGRPLPPPSNPKPPPGTTPSPQPNNGNTGNTPAAPVNGLDLLNKRWNKLPPEVQQQILQLLQGAG